MNFDELEVLYDIINHKLTKLNRYVFDHNLILTAVLGCHSNTLLFGSSEESKVAAHYIGPYVDKSNGIYKEIPKHCKRHGYKCKIWPVCINKNIE